MEFKLFSVDRGGKLKHGIAAVLFFNKEQAERNELYTSYYT